MASRKEYLAKVYSADGATLKRTLPDNIFRKSPDWSDRMNGGQGQIDMDLLLDPEDFGFGTTIDFDFVVQIYLSDDNYPNGQLVYSGVIEEIEPYANERAKGVQIKALGNATTLTFDYYRVSSAYAFTKNDTIQNVFKDILDKHNADESLALVNYDGSSVGAPGVTINHEFNRKTWHDALTETTEFAGEGWYWHVGADAIARLLEKSSTADHTFIVGKHVEYKAPKSVKKMYNVVRVIRTGDVAKDYTDVTSGHRRRLKIISDSSIQDETTQDARGNKFLDENDTPRNKTEITVYSSYNIESITPGDTCKLRNIQANTFFNDNMQIVSVQNKGDRAILELEETVSDFGAELDLFVNGD